MSETNSCLASYAAREGPPRGPLAALPTVMGPTLVPKLLFSAIMDTTYTYLPVHEPSLWPQLRKPRAPASPGMYVLYSLALSLEGLAEKPEALQARSRL